MPIRHLLVPLDGSRTAEVVLPYCRAFAAAFRARIFLLHVLENGRAGGTTFDSVDWRFRQAEAEEYLHALAAEMRDAGLRAEHELAEGRAAAEILHVASQGGFDLLALSAHGHGGATHSGLGGVAHKLVQRAGTSVLLVRAGENDAAVVTGVERPSLRRVVVAVDCSHQGDWALSIAARLARGLAADLRILHVVAIPDLPERAPGDFVHRVYRTRLLEANRSAARAYLDAAASQLRAPDLNVAVDLVEAPSVVQALAEYERGAVESLLVLSAHGLSQDSPFPYGPVVNHLLVHGQLPLLVLQDQPAVERTPHGVEVFADWSSPAPR
jgi:nucleotide-binding universal stress UspA family protein